MPAQNISIARAKQDKLFYFVANAVVYRASDGRCLILKRSAREKVHPGKYGVIGGKLEWKDLDIAHPSRIQNEALDFQDAVEDLLRREAREEAGIEIGATLSYINSVAFVRPDEVPVVMVKFAAEYKSGEVHLEEGAFSDYAWVNQDEVQAYDCIEGVHEEVAQTIERFTKR